MSIKHVRSRSRDIKLRALRRMDSSSDDDGAKADKDDNDDGGLLSPEKACSNRQHGRSDGELAKQKSSKRRDSVDKEKSSKPRSRRRDMTRRMSIKHVRSRSRDIKLRALHRMGSSSDDDDVKANKDDNDDGGLLSPEEAYNRQHGRSDGELAKRKSSNRRDSMDKEKSGKTSSRRSHRRPSLLIKKQSSHQTSKRSSQDERRRESSTAQRITESSELGQVVGATTVSSHELGEGEQKTEPGQPTSELDSYLAKKNNESRRSSRGSTRRSMSRDKDSHLPHESSHDSLPRVKKSFYRRHKWKCLCCCTLLILVVVAVVVTMIVLQAFDGGVSISVSMDGGISTTTSVGESDKGKGDGAGDTSKDTPSDKPTPVDILGTGMPSAEPSRVPTPPATTATPTPAPLADVTIAVIVQLDEKPEETGFSLLSADNSTTYVSMPIGSLAGRQSEVVMEVITVPEQTELVFELTDTSGNLCCDHGNGYYRILAGTGDKKITVISGERSAKYVYTVGKKHAVQIGGVDSNEYCKPCPGNGQDCGRCAWCNAANGFLPDTIYSWQCRTNEISVPPKCFVGPKRVQLHDQYVAAMAGCTNGFEAWPRIDGDASAAVDMTVCVQEAKCIKSFAFVEPDCNQELAGSLLAKETCQDKIGGVAFGYSFGLNAPRERDCPSSGEFATSLALRCCSDGVAYCSTFLEDGPSAMEDEKMPPTPVPAGTHAPTISNAPTWDGYPITLLIQLDDYPQETGFSITSMMQGQNVTFLERRPGYYKKSQLLVEKVQMPEGIDAVLTLTDQEGDGICCENGVGYFQVYSEEGSLILDEAGGFGSSVSQTFFVGDPKTLPPTGSAAPSESSAPTFDLFPITIAVQMDQWSDEVGLSIQSSLVGDGDGSHTFFDWPAGTFSGQASGLVVETVLLPRDIQATLRVTDTGGDGFCCLYGDGYIKIFAGESADDESDIIASESAEFEFEKVVTFQAGPAPSLAPATTPIPTISKTTTASTGPTSSSQPTVDAILVTIVLQLDKYSAETAWFIDSSDGLTNFIARPVGYYEGMESQKIIELVHLPEGLEYQFRILDFMGDGTCCWAGEGWYSLYEGGDINDNSTQVFYGNGDFGRERAHIFVAGKAKTPAPTSSRVPSGFPSLFPTMAPSLSLKPSVTKYPVEIQIKLDNHSSQTGWSITSADESTVITDRLPGYFSGNDTMTVVETIRLVAGEYKFTVLDSNGDGFCCQQGLGYYSLYANGQLLLFRQGEFEDSYSETFAIGFSLPVNDDLTVKSNSDPMLRGSIPSSYNPKRQRKHFGQKP